MVTLAEHHATVEIEKTGAVFRIVDMRLGMDLEWTPFIQATLTVPLAPDVDKLDPTASVLWVTVRLERVLGRTDTLGDFTRRYRDRKIGAVSADFDGKRLSSMTAATYHDYEEPGVARRQQTRTFRLIIESIEVDRAAAQATITLASSESLLLTDVNAGRDFTVQGPTWGDLLDRILARSGLTREAISPAFADVSTDSTPWNENARWQAATSAWDFLQQQFRAVFNYLIYGDATGIIRLRSDRSTTSIRRLRSAGEDRSVVNEVFRASREENWYEAVHIVWTNARGIASTGKRGPVLEVQRPWKAPEPIPEQPDIAARKLLDNVRRRGDALELLAVSDYSITPGDLGAYYTPRSNRSGRIVAVEWQWPQDEMSVRLREVETI